MIHQVHDFEAKQSFVAAAGLKLGSAKDDQKIGITGDTV